MRFFATLLLLLLLGAGSADVDPLVQFSREAARAEAEGVDGRGEDETECIGETAHRISFADLAVNSAGYAGRCISVEGLLWGNMLFGLPEHIYLAERFDVLRERRFLGAGMSNPFRVGVQSHTIEIPVSGPWALEVQILGIAADCLSENDRSARVSHIMTMIEGALIVGTRHDYCGWYDGPAINAIEVDVGDRRIFPRQHGSTARDHLGSLWEMPETAWPDAEVRASLLSLVARLRQGDRSLPSLMSDRFFGTWYSDRASFIRSETDTPSMRLFWTVNSDPPAPDNNDERHEVVYGCVCLEESCSGRWPISFVDTLPTDGQPYLCVRYNVTQSASGAIETELWPQEYMFGGAASPFGTDESNVR